MTDIPVMPGCEESRSWGIGRGAHISRGSDQGLLALCSVHVKAMVILLTTPATLYMKSTSSSSHSIPSGVQYYVQRILMDDACVYKYAANTH